MRRDDRLWRAQQRGQYFGRIEFTLPSGAQDADQDLLRVGSPPRAIPAATDLPRDDRRAQRLFGAPVRGVEPSIDEETEDRGQFDGQMPGEALDVWDRAGIGEHVEQLREQMPARDVHAVGRDRAGDAAIAHSQRVMQDPRDARWQARPRMIALQEPTPPEEMRETGLMKRLEKLPIRSPAIATEPTGEVGAEDGGGIPKSAPRADRVDRRGGRREDPQPMQHRPDLPAGFIRDDDGTGPYRFAERGVRGLTLSGRAMERAHQPARRDVQAEAVAEQRRDLPERQAELFVEAHGQGHGVRAQWHGGGTERVGGLQRMTPLNASLTAATAADMHIEAPHDRLHGRQIFLILRDDVRPAHWIATRWTRRRDRHVVRLVDHGRYRSAALASIGRAHLASRPPWPTLGSALRKRRRLPRTCPTRRLELVLQPRILALESGARSLEPRPVGLRPLQFVSQTHILAPQLLDPIRYRRFVGAAHPLVMPESARQYKSDPVTNYEESQ
jgi:hypothetical protein